MYSPKITQKRLENAEKTLKFAPRRRSITQVEAFRARFDDFLDDSGHARRPLDAEELDFIRDERILCKFDFRYWAERYGTILKDGIEGGGVGKIRFWKSQEAALAVLGEIEERCWEAAAAKESIDGICVAFHKARQLGATMFSRLLTMHRQTNWSHVRAMAASVDEDKIQELYDRDKLILDELPFYLKPSVGFDVKAEHIYFDKLNSRILYQQSKQQSGLGQGRQFDLGHLTECSSWPYPKMIEFDFFPTLPQGMNTLCVLESTANGRGNWWHEFTEEVRKGLHRRWRYIFTPWYIEDRKYRAAVPVNWTPSPSTLAHAKQVYMTSHEFVGRDVLLSKEQLYWYETERESALRRGSLNLFLTNYCATPEESFQHTQASQFSVEVLERIRLASGMPEFYEFNTYEQKTGRPTVSI